MNKSDSIQEIAVQIPLFAEASDLQIAPLSGVISLNNHNYRVDADGTAYVLRVGSETAHFLGIRRDEEIEAARAAAAAGLAPEILYAEASGVLVMPFIHGTHWQLEAFHTPANIERIAEVLHRLHSIKTVQAQGSEYRRIERLLESADAFGLELPPEIGDYRAKLARIEQERLSDSRYRPGLAHNDFWANNFFDDGEKLWLLDWEFSGTGDGMIDLATISIGSGYSKEEQIILLAAYGLTEPDDYTTLQTLKWVVCFFEACWALVMHGLRGSGSGTDGVTGDYNYEKHARRMFERLNSSVL